MNSRDPFSLDSHPEEAQSRQRPHAGPVLIILTLLLTITFLFQVSEKKYFFIPLTNTFYYFIGFFYLVTILYALSLRTSQGPRPLSLSSRSIVDHLFIAGLIYFTGGKESFFPMAYFFAIIGSSIFFYRRGAFFSASFLNPPLRPPLTLPALSMDQSPGYSPNPTRPARSSIP